MGTHSSIEKPVTGCPCHLPLNYETRVRRLRGKNYIIIMQCNDIPYWGFFLSQNSECF